MATITLDNRFFPKEWQDKSQELLPAAEKALQDLVRGEGVGQEWLGWFDYPQKKGLRLVEDVKSFVRDLPVHFDTVVVIGIGGSYLGTRAVHESLSHTYLGLASPKLTGNRPLVVYAGHNLSESSLIDLLDLLENREPIVNVISKSGTTTEPSIAWRVLRSYLAKRYSPEEAKRRVIVTTDPHSGALRAQAREAGYASFEVPSDIGGRYSVLTPVGLVPLALAGVAVDQLMSGADAMFSELKQADANHPALRYAVMRQTAYSAGKAVELLVFSDPKLASMVEWWKQLFGESQGKEGKGLLPGGLACTTDLHSLGQYVQEGQRNLFETFLAFNNPRASSGHVVERQLRIPHARDNSDQLGYIENRLIEEVNATAVLGTRLAHADGGVPNIELKLPRLDEYHLGALIAFFETSCAVGGPLLGVNPFDQPGVEAYKSNLFALLGKPGTEDQRAALRQRLRE